MSFNRRKYHLKLYQSDGGFLSQLHGALLFIFTDLAVHLAISGGRSSLIFKRHD